MAFRVGRGRARPRWLRGQRLPGQLDEPGTTTSSSPIRTPRLRNFQKPHQQRDGVQNLLPDQGRSQHHLTAPWGRKAVSEPPRETLAQGPQSAGRTWASPSPPTAICSSNSAARLPVWSPALTPRGGDTLPGKSGRSPGHVDAPSRAGQEGTLLTFPSQLKKEHPNEMVHGTRCTVGGSGQLHGPRAGPSRSLLHVKGLGRKGRRSLTKH